MPFDGQVTETNTDKLILQRARDRVARGWCQCEYVRADGAVCATEAIIQAAHDAGAYDLNHFRLLLGFKSIYGRPATYLTAWNDEQGRTQEEVLARFDEAIAKLETNNG